jgi:ABC-2 type transport system permease protein
MSTATAHTAARTGRADGVTLGRTINSELIKFRTLWSCVLVSSVSVVGMIAIGWVGSYFTNADWAHLRPRELARFDPIVTSMNGYNMAELAVGTLGVLLVTGEYTTGMIRATLTAVPTRLPVLWAKLIVYTALNLVLMTVASVVSFVGGQALLGSHGTTLTADGAVRVVVATALYLTLVGVLGVAFGALVRNTAGGIAALFGVLLVLPVIIGVLPSSWQDVIGQFLPSNAGQAALAVKLDPSALPPWTGMALFGGYVIVAVAAAAMLLKRRDV